MATSPPSSETAVRPAAAADPLLIPVRTITGVGPTRARQLQRLGIVSVRDLLYHRPRRYEDRRHLARIDQLVPGQKQSTQGTVVALSERRYGTYQFQAAIADAGGVLQCIWFGQRYLRRLIRRGTRLVVYGRVEYRGARVMTVEEFEILTGDEDDALHTQRIVPVHPATEGLSPRLLRTIIHRALSAHAAAVPEILPPALLEREGFPGRSEALWALHFPSTLADAAAARARLAFDELFLLQLGVQMRRRAVAQVNKGYRYDVGEEAIQAFVDTLPFSLTSAQQRALREIVDDLRAPAPMNRLLQGDVGSGKTVLAAAALYLTARSGHQGVLMAPTEILAEQHFRTIRRLLDPLGVTVALLTGSAGRRDREELLARLAAGRVDVVLGTHALLEGDVIFHHLGLVIVDEQHKFGVLQRARLRRKGFHPDVLVMTATPIPRTLMMTLYGDLDVSVLDELPPGRGVVKTYWRGPEKRPQVYAWVREQVRRGARAYVVCPLIEESEKLQVEAAVHLAERLRTGLLAGLPVGLLHGRMRPEEKEQVMAGFRRGDLTVLVTTSVIEVGVDVPEATIMVIEDADRFGLAQLHQLRGRIGRGTGTSYCVLLAQAATEEARMRLETLAATHDGFAIAQADLDLRGPGELLGTRQHGLPDLRVADLARDLPLLERARDEAARLLAADPELADPRMRATREELRALFTPQETAAVG
ncbi:MAG: ATP-dependent DNA helicase RecG [Armatimonadota bacterium]|nr:ATP-dependent DNA helicase RecG [Armatimonadota bacterium]MDR7450297.1 ATP-dependent DNA helicase RecG [Armatimonadota bacterium]MDR7467120.1 ATP-dependent DNA helicase RecG [Armatimonadota bacterium]MDR7493338.1 ATP-dependent DNA helicase RecG [Armatimonadota bacterium]MDR7499346.1 ATP-dependent DNA helicase RecG [Armatimonadota bacterium]